MEKLLPQFKIEVNDRIYLKDPESSELGRRILSCSLQMIEEMGMEAFTFRKLSKALNTTESSIYRYFESKHRLLLYFYNWYWSWVEIQIAFNTHNINDPFLRLEKAIEILCDIKELGAKQNAALSVELLANIVVSESSKAYMTKEVDEENKNGFFLAFKHVSYRLVEIIQEIEPNCAYANTLAATCMEGILHQQFFAEHLPSLSNLNDEQLPLKSIFYQIIVKNLTQS